MRLPRWLGGKPEPSKETVELREKLQEVKSDDKAILDLHRRTRQILSQNHLASDIAKALGLK